MSDSSKPRGHGHQVSVADAALLFGSGADDPFAAILSPSLGDIGEEAEEKAAGAHPPPATTATVVEEAPDQGTPTLTSSLKLADTEEPASLSKGTETDSAAPSTSTLFDSSSPTDLFSASSANDDWLNEGTPAQETPAHFGQEQATDGNDLEYDQYNGYGVQYGEHQQAPTEHGINGYGENSDPYQQNAQYAAHQYDYQQQYGDQQYNGHYYGQQEGYGEQGHNTNHYGTTTYDQQSNNYLPASQYDYSAPQQEEQQNYVGQPQVMTTDPYASAGSGEQKNRYLPNVTQQYEEQQLAQDYRGSSEYVEQKHDHLRGSDYAAQQYDGQQGYREQQEYANYQYETQQQYDPYTSTSQAFEEPHTKHQDLYDPSLYSQQHAEEPAVDPYTEHVGQYANYQPQAAYDSAAYGGPEQSYQPEPFQVAEPPAGAAEMHADPYQSNQSRGVAEQPLLNQFEGGHLAAPEEGQYEQYNNFEHDPYTSSHPPISSEKSQFDPYEVSQTSSLSGEVEANQYGQTGLPFEEGNHNPYDEEGHQGSYEETHTGPHTLDPDVSSEAVGDSQIGRSEDDYRGDDTVQPAQDYTPWGGAEEDGDASSNNVDIYSPSKNVREDSSNIRGFGASDYFSNVGMAPFNSLTQNRDGAEADQYGQMTSQYAHSRSGDEADLYSQVTSPYQPPPPSSLLSSHGGGPTPHSRGATQELAVDAAEQRRQAKIPLASFSIDGKLLTFFPTWAEDIGENGYGGGSVSGGYGMGRSGVPTKVTLRPLRSLIPPTTYASSKNPLDFPGPALEVVTSQSSALSRATGTNAAANKAKKASLIKYLNDAATEMASGIGYLTAGKHALEANRIQDRILILRMLVLILEHDGSLVNNAAFDTSAKDLLLADDGIVPKSDIAISAPLEESVPGPSADQKANFLDQIEGLLVIGQRKEAVEVAVRTKMWTHAVVIASGMDVTTWREVVGQFMQEEFDENGKSHQGLKVAYNLFSGQEPKATYELFRPKASLSGSSVHSEEAEAKEVDHAQWRKAAATILANRSNGDSATLTAIGDGLKMSGWIEASHVCYLLSPTTSVMDGHDGSSVRMTLLGAMSPVASTSYVRDLDHIILTEVYEFALSLQPIAKGAEAYHGMAYLQPYRLLHAYLLAEMGDVKQAIRYCDSIMTLLKNGKMNRHYHPVLLSQLQELSNRLQGDTKSVNWMKKKPTMDSVWGALEGRFTKFIAGEDENAKGTISSSKGTAGPTIGPFSHYSAITPDAKSGGVSRVQSTADFGSAQALNATSRPHSRPGSAVDLGVKSGISPLSHNFRTAGSEHSYGEWTPSSARESSGYSSPKQSFGQQSSSDAELYSGPYTTHATNGAPWYDQDVIDAEGRQQEGKTTPTDSAYYGYQPHGATHSQFVSNVEENLSTAMNGASLDDSPMDVLGNAPTPGFTSNSYAPPPNNTNYAPTSTYEEDEEDLGFGNKSSKQQRESQENEGNGSKEEQTTPTPEKKAESVPKPGELKPTSSWFGRLWRKDSSADAGEGKAVKAHMGEEVTFYYDKDLKRWINKKAGDTSSAPATPPPPPRAQTASPSVMNGGGSGPPSSFADSGPRRIVSESIRPPPPPTTTSFRSSSTSTPPISEVVEPGSTSTDGSAPRPPAVNRLRSNLADHSQPPALQPPTRPSTTTSEGGGPPQSLPGSGPPKSKKPISKRYVRVD